MQETREVSSSPWSGRSPGEGNASPGSMHVTGCLGRVHWDDPEGWNGEGGGRRTETKELSQESKVGTNTVVSSSQGSGNEEHRS